MPVAPKHSLRPRIPPLGARRIPFVTRGAACPGAPNNTDELEQRFRGDT